MRGPWGMHARLEGVTLVGVHLTVREWVNKGNLCV